MRMVCKYPLTVFGVQDIEMPAGAALLTVQAQRNMPFILAEVDSGAPKIKRRFRTCGTGRPIDEEEKFPHYVGTYQLNSETIEFHVYTDRMERT